MPRIIVPITGAKHQGPAAERILRTRQAGARGFHLVADPHNRFDEHAIKVRFKSGETEIVVAHVGATLGKICQGLKLHGNLAVYEHWPDPAQWANLDIAMDWRGETPTLVIQDAA